MSAREWKPGDLAVATVRGEPGVVVAKDFEYGEVWVSVQRVHGQHRHDERTFISDLRPLVAIDPEDRETVAALARAFLDEESPLLAWHVSHMEAALRSLLAPPEPEEPSTWGVVEASCEHSKTRQKWVRHPDGNWWPAWDYSKMPERTPQPDDWGSLVDPVVIREGVSTDA